ncbi:MAG: hypothetical protein M1821_000541 [Bathelium mastoideum]|nr:MAG: hypothetical protein M1821_000541 [Bathelium mastoideum]
MATTIRPIRFLSTSQIQRLHINFIANTNPSQPGLLESAVASPINVMHYNQQNDIFQLAANLSHKIMKNHAFSDGNKRTGLFAADLFLRMNGYQLHSTSSTGGSLGEDLRDALVAVTTDKWDVERLAHSGGLPAP